LGTGDTTLIHEWVDRRRAVVVAVRDRDRVEEGTGRYAGPAAASGEPAGRVDKPRPDF
jgi:hypothetical protein